MSKHGKPQGAEMSDASDGDSGVLELKGSPESHASADPIRIIDAFGRMRRGDPRPGDLSALGIVLVALSAAPLAGSIFLGSSARMWVALAVAAVLMFSGACLIIAAVRMNDRSVRHRWTGSGTHFALDGESQCACIESIHLPHGTKDRDVWLGVWVKDRCYPHPLRVLRGGTLSGCHVGLGSDSDAGKRFRVVVYAIEPSAAEAIEDYYERATSSGRYAGIPKRSWPKGQHVDELFAFSCRRQHATETSVIPSLQSN